MTMTVVVVKGHGGRLSPLRNMSWPIGRIDEKQILVPIIVVIQESHAAPHGFRQELFPVRAIVMYEIHARFPGDIGESGDWYFGLRPVANRGGRESGDPGGWWGRPPLNNEPSRDSHGNQDSEHHHGPAHGAADDAVVGIDQVIRRRRLGSGRFAHERTRPRTNISWPPLRFSWAILLRIRLGCAKDK